MAKRITWAQAEQLDGLLTMFGTPEAAAHQCRVQLTALGPYSDRQLSDVANLLVWLSAANAQCPELAQARRATIARIAQGQQS